MTFTDDDLRILKDWAEKVDDLPLDALPKQKTLALLSRLEAAENAIFWGNSLDRGKQIEAWRKACGK